MSSYILFIFGSFEDHEDLEYFCIEHFSQVSEAGLKYVIESTGNCVIIFDSDKDKKTLIQDIKTTLDIEHIKFYLMFEKDSVFYAELPEAIRDFIFKPSGKKDNVFDKISVKVVTEKYDLDTILEKIQISGIDSLTEGEKKYLDEFGK